MNGTTVMKTLTLTAIVAGILVLPLLLRSKKTEVTQASTDEDKRYDINDDLLDWEP